MGMSGDVMSQRSLRSLDLKIPPAGVGAGAAMILVKAFQDFTWLKNSGPFTVKSSLWNLILNLFNYCT